MSRVGRHAAEPTEGLERRLGRHGARSLAEPAPWRQMSVAAVRREPVDERDRVSVRNTLLAAFPGEPDGRERDHQGKRQSAGRHSLSKPLGLNLDGMVDGLRASLLAHHWLSIVEAELPHRRPAPMAGRSTRKMVRLPTEMGTELEDSKEKSNELDRLA